MMKKTRWEDGKEKMERKNLRKHYLPTSLKECYHLFQADHPNITISFSSFL